MTTATRVAEARRGRADDDKAKDASAVVGELRARDLAYLASVVDLDKGEYPRKQIVLEQVQQAWRVSNDIREPRTAILVKTSWQEERERPRSRRA